MKGRYKRQQTWFSRTPHIKPRSVWRENERFMPPKSPFTDSVKKRIREKFGQTCTICLNHLPVEASHCAHLFDASSRGEQQVIEAVSLGLLSPHKQFDRSWIENGIVQCPTCHLGYFTPTPPRLVLSPPIPVLQWISRKLESATSSGDVWNIFTHFEFTRSKELLPYKNHYSLIPFFHSEDESYELYCNMPPSAILTDGVFRELAGPRRPDQQGIYRIFSFSKAVEARAKSRTLKAGIVKFTRAVSTGGYTDCWYIPVPCHVILYLFLARIRGLNSPSPEVAMGHQIYARLLIIRGPTSSPIVWVEAEDSVRSCYLP
ncbi:hypothetical protein DFH06DRAFT_1179282 [Mycena polygramma]|nr:hypothetical protein DFH06DRAFT_1179282 [Mycena polygramma]